MASRSSHPASNSDHGVTGKFSGVRCSQDKGGGYTNLRESRDRFEISVDGLNTEAFEGEPLIEAINRSGRELAQVCYHHQLGPIQTCDTCMVEVDGKLVRACATMAETA